MLGVLAGMGGYTFYYAKGAAYLSNDPKACVNCHIMRDQYDSWQKASHHSFAMCNDCHVPHDFVGKWLTKAGNGYHHSEAFTLQNFHEPIQIRPSNAAVLKEMIMKKLGYLLLVILVAGATVGVMLLRENIATRKEEAKQVVFKLVDLNEQTIDPAQWGKNFPRQFDGYQRTAERTGTKYGGGGSETLSPSKLEEDPRLKTIFAGYAFSVDYRQRRGHAYMLTDQRETKGE